MSRAALCQISESGVEALPQLDIEGSRPASCVHPWLAPPRRLGQSFVGSAWSWFSLQQRHIEKAGPSEGRVTVSTRPAWMSVVAPSPMSSRPTTATGRRTGACPPRAAWTSTLPRHLPQERDGVVADADPAQTRGEAQGVGRARRTGCGSWRVGGSRASPHVIPIQASAPVLTMC